MSSISASFPSWRELGDILYKKLHGRFPNEEVRYLSILKLAEQVQAAFGRPALDELIRREIPDLTYEPSPLHSQLLNLPWRDVFSTNYDTLIERACASVTLKHYDVVAKKDDLLHANQPRIVKLHGSFPSGPFIITEEDYRRYPTDNAPFVNTVRQSLIENTLCLLGFSGDDPNFLQWLGWVRDHVGNENMLNIYLVGVFDTQSEADRKLLDRRGIVAVDLSVFGTDPGKAMGEFLNQLKRRESRAPDWPTLSRDTRSWARKSNSRKYRDIVAEWRRQRSEYPGWVVTPESRRRFLSFYTEQWQSHLSQMPPADRAGLETPLDLELAFELAWRLERCLFPLTAELAVFLEEVATKYGDAPPRFPEKTDWTRSSVFEAVAEIRLWLLRHYREEGQGEKWREVRQAVEDDSGKLLPEHRAKFRLEEALQAIFQFDPTEAKRLLTNWQPNDSLPFWEAKRAALMAELGETAAARSILEASLSAIRRHLSLKPVIKDYTLVSQESVVMLLLWAVKRGMAVEERSRKDINLPDELSDRWNELARYRCDPNREIASLSTRLDHPSRGWKQKTVTHSFDLGFVFKTLHFGIEEEAVAAYGLLRMYEDIGMPYRMENTTFVQAPVESTLPRMRPCSPHWALVNIVRLGDAKAVDLLFDREYLAGLGREEVDGFFDIYLPALERTIAMVNEPDFSEAKNFETLAKTLPEVFSRLCYKCSPACRDRLIGALRSIYGSHRRQMFANVRLFADRLLDSMSVKERIRAVPSLIDFPMPDCLSELEMRNFVNPMLLVDLPMSVRGDALLVTEERIEELLDRLAHASQERAWVMTSLVWLYERGKLNEHQSERLGKLLWIGVEAPGVAIVAGHYSFVCVTLPHPEEVDPEQRVKERLRSMIDIHMEDSRLDDVLDELHDSAGVINWSREDALEFVAVMSEWWDEHKSQLRNCKPVPFGSPAKNTKRTITKAVRALSKVFSHLPADNDDKEVDSLRGLIVDLAEHEISAIVLEAAALNMLDAAQEQFLNRVKAAMADNDRDVIVDALLAAQILAQRFAEKETRGEFAAVAKVLVQGVRWRHSPALADRLRVMTNLVERQPWFLSAEPLTGILAGLEKISEETSSGVRGNDEDGVIDIRASAASLAFALFEYYQEAGSEVPEAIRRWQELCHDPDEFSDVMNSWRGFADNLLSSE